MVGRGEFLERMTVIEVPGGHLEGLYSLGDAKFAAMLVPGYPGLGGTMDATVLAELAWALRGVGASTLRFNFRGAGASSWESTLPRVLPGNFAFDDDSLASADEDLNAAISLLQDTTGENAIPLVGYSFGALVAARAALNHPSVDQVVLIAPPVTQAELFLAQIHDTGCRVHLITGSADTTCSPDALRQVAARNSAHPVGVTEIPSADHVFSRGLTELGVVVASSLET